MKPPLHERTAIVTGAGGGIGRATALALGAAGADVVAADIDHDAARETVALVEQAGTRGLALGTDVSDVGEIERMVADAAAWFRRIDILVNNAANLRLAADDGDVMNADFDLWDQTYRINLRGSAAACKFAIPHMLERGRGAIVNVSSIAGLNGDVRRPAYGASKAGLDLVTRSIATAYGKRGIRCNGVCPGIVMTPETRQATAREVLDVYLANVLTHDIARPEQIADIIVFLCSDQASYITGQILVADGGLSAHLPWHAAFDLLADQALR